jgi:hypothetical protein
MKKKERKKGEGNWTRSKYLWARVRAKEGRSMGTRRTEHVRESGLVLGCTEGHEVVWVEWAMSGIVSSCG